MREIEVAVGYSDMSWRSIWVTVPEEDCLTIGELKERAIDIALHSLGNVEREGVAFLHVLYFTED